MKRLHCWGLMALIAMTLGSAGLRGQGAPIDRKSADAHAYNTLKEVINHGADLYNSGDWNGCYRLYEGALLALKPFLDHRADLVKAIDEGVARAKANPALDRRAFDLRTVIDKVRADTNPGGTRKVDTPPPPPAGKLWDRLGGEANVKNVINDLVAAAAGDKDVDFFRGGKAPLDAAGVAKLKKLLLEFISQETGGPYKYTGRSMKESHKGMEITEAQFNKLAGHLVAALKKNGAKDADIAEVVKAVGATKADIVESKKPDPSKDKPDPSKDKPDPSKDKPDPSKAKTLWEKLGGEANVKKVVDDFVAAAATDKDVDFFRGGKFALDAGGVMKLKRLLVEFVSKETGGPLKYMGKSMKESHKGMEITEAQFNKLAGHLKDALKKNGAKDEDIDLVLKAVAATKGDIVEPKKPEPPKDKDKKDK